jgi:hypothetical protein
VRADADFAIGVAFPVFAPKSMHVQCHARVRAPLRTSRSLNSCSVTLHTVSDPRCVALPRPVRQIAAPITQDGIRPRPGSMRTCFAPVPRVERASCLAWQSPHDRKSLAHERTRWLARKLGARVAARQMQSLRQVRPKGDLP